MFRYFPDNYGWSLVVLRILVSGGQFGEVDWVCRNLRSAATSRPRGDGEAWHLAWKELAAQLETLAEERLQTRHVVSAADAFYRSSLYYQWVEAFLPPADPRAESSYVKHLETFAKFAGLSKPRIEIVDIPFEGKSLKAYFIPEQRGADRTPCVITAGGLDGTKEETFPLALAMTRRGMSSLVVDLPGQGATLRLSGLPMRFDTERPIAAAIDYLAKRADVDVERIGIAATSAGGYSAPRAAAFDKRIKACVAWAAIYDYWEIWKKRLLFKDGIPVGFRPEIPFPVTEQLVLRILGVGDWVAALQKLQDFRLQGVAKQITCDFLIVQGENDPQTPVSEAQLLFDEVQSVVKELRIYKDADGGSAHVQVDRPEPALSLIADWMADRLNSI